MPPPPSIPSLPSLPTDHPPSPLSEQTLTALLTTYLLLLDTYTTQRTTLSTQFSSGFLSLAHANRNAASLLGAGRRFGMERYDERMKAVQGVRVGARRVTVGLRGMQDGEVESEDEDGDEEGKGGSREKEEGCSREKEKEEGRSREKETEEAADGAEEIRRDCEWRNESVREEGRRPRVEEGKKEGELDLSQRDEPEKPKGDSPEEAVLDSRNGRPPSSTPRISSLYTYEIVPLPSPSPSSTTENSKKFNPLTQFHPLPPPSLHQTQHHFHSSLPTISALLNTISQMRCVEREIWRVRREMGLDHGYQLYLRAGDRAGELDEEAARGESERSGDGGNEKGGKTREYVRDDGEDDAGEDEDSPAMRSSTLPSLSSPLTKRTLASRSRPAEPRSRVLKMD